MFLRKYLYKPTYSYIQTFQHKLDNTFSRFILLLSSICWTFISILTYLLHFKNEATRVLHWLDVHSVSNQTFINGYDAMNVYCHCVLLWADWLDKFLAVELLGQGVDTENSDKNCQFASEKVIQFIPCPRRDGCVLYTLTNPRFYVLFFKFSQKITGKTLYPVWHAVLQLWVRCSFIGLFVCVNFIIGLSHFFYQTVLFLTSSPRYSLLWLIFFRKASCEFLTIW